MTLLTHFTLNRRRLLCGCAGLAALSLVGCKPNDPAASGDQPPTDMDHMASCSLDGMLLADFPGPKGQIQYANDKQVHWFCDTVELLSMLLAPEQVRAVRAAYVQDMGKADWDRPQGQWIVARNAWFVLGSKRHGSMGPTAASFAEETAAQSFVQTNGGRLLRFADIKPEMVDLSGGALHDTRM
ncbi:nitrous oxide reductase accessory protein NosL [Rhodoferax sp.]|uniref:nitrous oxide reductase accessory protein NosL n=1 Tax=Rhodoferax sp. TaxID=50421 RepID=UPI0026332CC6|nr:nitrous oxide reductase accessory protein NosL [Rhodoferax sp.]MDD3935095.1 nitrous oxide reductase accessory protein NosL [Rhodoferax sp.]